MPKRERERERGRGRGRESEREAMRRDGILTGYVWSRNSWGKVKVKGKPTNASKASGRCTHAKCRSCHQQPVSKSKSKTKGRNKRLSKLLVDEDWAFCKHSSAHRINTVLSVSSCSGYLHDADEYACEVHDACHAVANLMGRDMLSDGLGASDATDKEDVHGDIISDVHAHNCVKDVPMQGFAPDGSLGTVMMRFQVMYSDCFANARVAAINNNGSDIIHGFHAIMSQAKDAVALKHDGSNANQAALAHAAGGVSDDDAVHDVNDPSVRSRSHAHNVMITTIISDPGSLNTAIGCIPDINPGRFAHDRDVAINDDGRDVNSGGRAVTPHVKDAVFLKHDDSNANHVKMLHAADAVSDDDAILDDDDDDHDFQSLILGRVNVDWPKIDDKEEVSDVIYGEADSLCGDWCLVACSDAIDDWYLC